MRIAPVILTVQLVTGVASVYHPSLDGNRTTFGETYRNGRRTFASRHLKPGTYRVTNLRTGLSATARMNDRGPFVRGRSFDLSPALKRAIRHNGLEKVSVTPVRRKR